jgi:hypothetical protein
MGKERKEEDGSWYVGDRRKKRETKTRPKRWDIA